MSELPDSWIKAPLGSLLSSIVGGGTPSKANADHFRGAIPFMTVKDMHARFIKDTQDHITEAALADSASTLIPADTLIVASRMSLGKVARPKVPVAINQDLKALFLHHGVSKTYVEYLWRANEERIRGMGTGTTVKGIRLEDIRGLEVPIAPSNEQTRIADQLDTLLARVNACNNHLDAIPGILKRFRQAVIRTAMTGGLSDALAEVLSKEWTTSTIGGVTVDLRYGTSKKCDYGAEGVGVLRIPNITPAGGVSQSDLKSAQFDEQETKKLALKSGDLLVIRSNGSLDLVGRCGLVSEKDEGLLFAGYLMRLRVNTDLVRPAFIMYWLMASDQRKRIELLAKSTSGVNNLNAEELRSLPLRFPTLPEQDEILRKIEVYMACADRIEARYIAMHAHAKRLAPQILSKAFRGELVEQDTSDEPASVLLERLSTTTSVKASNTRGRPRVQTVVSTTSLVPQAPMAIDWRTLPANEWAAPAAAQDQAIMVCLAAVLRAWDQPITELEARLATLLCQQPRVFTAVLPAAQAKEWARLVGDEAKPLPVKVARLQPLSNSPWGQAIKRMRARGDLVESGGGDGTTWSLGPGASAIDTAGWPDGRAAFVAAHLRAHGVESILPALDAVHQAFVHVRAA